MIVVDLILAIISVLLFTPSLVLFVQVLSATLFTPSLEDDVEPTEATIAVLIPAHNESQGIVATLNSIKPQLKHGDRILVVADNCSDDTYSVALENGVEAIQRHDLANRGKGFALDFGVQHLSKLPPKVLVIIDADCVLAPDCLGLLAAFSLKNYRPIQALDMMYAKGDDLKSKIAEFAWCVKNMVRPLGYANLGLPCQLMGTGMAFPWAIIANTDIANGNLVEDMKLGLDLSKLGLTPMFYMGAKVSSYFPLASDVQSSQHRRWEHGHLAMIIKEAPKLIAQGFIKTNKNLLAIALDLSVPPLALLVVLLFGYASLLAVLYAIFHIGQLALTLTATGIILLIIAIGLAWLGWGRKIISFSSMMLLPVYIFLKIPNYIKFLSKRQKTWTKTERD
jgi:cellulose synthase/poly-beta-1,6-N-acetylglucosamine synthase-like glycosyltransferase